MTTDRSRSSQSRLSRRGFLRLTGAATALTLFGGAVQGCAVPAAPAAPGAAGGSADAATTEISWFEWGDINDKAIADGTIAGFEAANPGITVRLEQPPSNYYDKLQASVAAGTAPDILNMQTWLWQSFAAKGVVASLDEFQARDNFTEAFPTLWQGVYDAQTRFRGSLYGVPWNMNAMLMFYSKEPFDRLGLDYPTDDWTYDEFKSLTEQLTQEVDGVQYYGYQTNTSYERLACWMRLHGDKEWDQEVEPHEARWDQDPIMDMLNFQLYEVVNTLKVSPTPAMMQGGTNQLQSGNVAMKMEGPWFFPQMVGEQAKTAEGTPFDVAQLPLSPNGTRAHMVFGHVLTINAASEQKEVAWEFLKFAGGAGGQENVAKGGRQPVTPEFMEQFWVPDVKERYGIENTDSFIKAFETGILHLAGEVDDRMITNEVFGPARDAIVAGEVTAFEAIPEVNAKIQEMLDAFWETQG